MLRQLPNALTLLRLLLALPLGLMILRQDYHWALAVGFTAGISDALDGFFARRLDATSKLGAILDPVADKTLITVAFVCLAYMQVIPFYLAAIVIVRDLVIISGAICYYKLIGPFEFAATGLSKANMFVQICFCVAVLTAQLVPIADEFLQGGIAAVVFFAASSGFHYVMTWSIKAVQARSGSS